LFKVPLKPLAFDPLTPPVKVPLMVGGLQLYAIPEGIVPVKVGEKGTPLHTVSDTLLIDATGNTATFKVNGEETHRVVRFGVTV